MLYILKAQLLFMASDNHPRIKITKNNKIWTLGKKYGKWGYYIYKNQSDAEEVASVRRYQGYLALVQYDVKYGWLVYVRRDWHNNVRR